MGKMGDKWEKEAGAVVTFATFGAFASDPAVAVVAPVPGVAVPTVAALAAVPYHLLLLELLPLLRH